ncbi:MAG: phosphoribosylformylglycinamidine cyclo-ligase [Gammaproteobacteria bacterium]|nr:phosphoribosylformylglycinamidine cyclo-ligase [Gammaproteobacteria bacterium]
MTKENIDNDPYKSAGVDITAGNNLIELIKGDVALTQGKDVLGGIGGFAGMYRLNNDFQNPVLVACTDGVGTKVALAQQYNKLENIGQDLVAMCVNDLVTCGAQPLFFLDYFATSKLDVKEASLIIGSIARACRASGCALLGGETAEMPGHYIDNNFDLAGFSVGCVDEDKIIKGDDIEDGDILIGIESSGAHSNGYSLIRKVLEQSECSNDEKKEMVDLFLKPTHLYPKVIQDLTKNQKIKGMSHITGGGLTENLPRSIPKNMAVKVYKKSWDLPKEFQWLKDNGNITEEDMYRIFNCGIGMVLIVNTEDVSSIQSIINDHGYKNFEIGFIERSAQTNISYI